MLNSTILDVAIGMVFCFASVALLVSALSEAISSALKLRHKALLDGIKQLLNDPKGVGLVSSLYNHALVSPLGSVTPAGQIPKSLPAYIPSQAFAVALLDAIQSGPGDFASVTAAIRTIPDPQLQNLMQGFVVRANGKLETLQSQVADWFDNAMDRLSGHYKRRTQVITFVLGFGVALAFNIDSFHVLSELWARPSMASAITGPGVAALIDARKPSSGGPAASGTAGMPAFPVAEWATTLQQLPVGWAKGQPNMFYDAKSLPDYVFYLVGLLITASTAVFGAPFWFDLLQRLVQIRGTGTKPPTERDRNKTSVVSAATP